MRKTKFYSIITIICITGMIFSFLNAEYNTMTKNNENLTNNHQNIQFSASTLNNEHQILPVSILVYTEYTDINDEFVRTMEAIDNTYGTDYYYENLTDYTNLDSALSGHDIFLIPEQEKNS